MNLGENLFISTFIPFFDRPTAPVMLDKFLKILSTSSVP